MAIVTRTILQALAAMVSSFAPAFFLTAGLATTAMAQTRLPDPQFSAFEGWWRFENRTEGCDSDKVSQRINISRSTNNGDIWQLQTAGGTCRDLVEVDGTFDAIALCQSPAGSSFGRANFFQTQNGRFYIETPLSDAVLIKCEAEDPLRDAELEQVAGRSQNDGDAAYILELLTGWWRYEDNEWGCSDSDGQYRAALGRYNFNDTHKLVYGNGPLRFGFYEGQCELNDLVRHGSTLKMTAQCEAEGETVNGSLTVDALNNNTILIDSPVMMSTLVACDPGQGDGIAMLAGHPVRAATVETDPYRSSPLVGSSAQEPTPMVVLPKRATEVTPPLKSRGQRIAILAVYADFCEPSLVYDRNGMDLSFYEPYRNQFLVRYAANCDTFFRIEAAPVLVLPDLERALGAPLPEGPSQLDRSAALAAGIWAFARISTEVQACIPGSQLEEIQLNLAAPLDTLLTMATQNDVEQIGYGFSQAKTVFSMAGTFPCISMMHLAQGILSGLGASSMIPR